MFILIALSSQNLRFETLLIKILVGKISILKSQRMFKRKEQYCLQSIILKTVYNNQI